MATATSESLSHPPMTGTPASYLSVRQFLAAYRDGHLSPVEAVAGALDRIAELDPVLGSVVAVDAGPASAAARVSEQCWHDGRPRALEGVPVLVKEMIDTAGLATAYGSALFRGHRPERDAEAVRRLRSAGAIVLGKTATHEFAWGVTTESSAYGVTRNPWDTTRVPGGSSGGSAAALAAGLAPLALGTDTAGSIRIPAALCGVTGLKPTHGAVPATGTFPLAPSLDHVGPMARTVADVRLALRVLCPGGRRADPPGRSLRVGVLGPFDSVPLPGAVAAALDEAALRLRAAAHDARPVAVPRLESAYAILGVHVACEGLAVHRGAGLYPASAGSYLPGVRFRLELAASRAHEDLEHAEAERRSLTGCVRSLFTEVDAVVSAVVAGQPAPIGHDRDPGSKETALFRARMMAYTAWASLAGVPACSVPVGTDADGLPVALQVCAPWAHEERALDIAGVLERPLRYPAVARPN